MGNRIELEYCKKHSENVSRFIREAMREKIETGLLTDTSLDFVEIRARTPYTFFGQLDRAIDGDSLVVNIDLGFFLNITTKISEIINLHSPFG